MKKLCFLLILITCMLSVGAQSGYYYGDKFIELTKKSGMPSYIVPSKFLVNHQGKVAQKESYVSLVYQTANVESIIVLPRIILEIFANNDITSIISDYKDALEVSNMYDNTYYLDCYVKTSEEVLALVKNLSKQEGVKWCEPDMYSNIRSCNNNPLYREQWYLKNNGYFAGMDINIEPAWQLVKGTSSVTVAVVDTGVDLEHEDLASSLLKGYTVGEANGDGAPKYLEESERKGHGTCCAGIVGAIDNNIGVVGVANGVKILPVNIAPYHCSASRPEGFASDSEIAQAIRWAYPKADVLSCSWGGGVASNDIANAITEARTKGRNGKGTVVVFSSGNSYGTVSFPGNVDGVLTVGAIDQNGEKCDYSNTGAALDLVAFGEHVLTTDVTGNLGLSKTAYYSEFNGTSAACPQVAGVAALMLSANPNLIEKTVKKYLKETARDLGEKGRDDMYGYGLVDAKKAVVQVLKGIMTITGPTIVDTKAIYRVKNLPNGCTVSWSQESISSALPSSTYMEVGKPEANAVTVYNKTGFAIKLKATIHFPNDIVAPYVVSMTISGPAPTLSGLFYEISPDGSKTYDSPLVDDADGDINYATPANDVVITSNNFVNRDVYYYYSPESWNRHYVQVRENQIIFEMPSLGSGQTLNFSVMENGSTLYTFKFAANESMIYQSPISIVETSRNGYQINIDSGLLKQENKGKKEVVVVDISSGGTLLREVIHCESHALDLSRLSKGFYAIQVNVGNKTKSKKILIEK
ncbi:S8 family serine peptidase [Segatella copri]|uniref:S8 family serine peptidase n=1 Tax=Segatella copri TaxID=165179 RepID=UPI0019332334|nr:S8 family serine peptidase [Segatella copri]MBM0145049.1 S8 family serine peptidase [Segatella copri]